jgi:hypothetical protein
MCKARIGLVLFLAALDMSVSDLTISTPEEDSAHRELDRCNCLTYHRGATARHALGILLGWHRKQTMSSYPNNS